MFTSSCAGPVHKFKINGLPKDKDFASMPFGRQIEHYAAIRQFKHGANVTWLSQKRQSSSKAIKEAIKLYDVDQYYCSFNNSPNYRDDSFEFFYTTKND